MDGSTNSSSFPVSSRQSMLIHLDGGRLKGMTALLTSYHVVDISNLVLRRKGDAVMLAKYPYVLVWSMAREGLPTVHHYQSPVPISGSVSYHYDDGQHR